MRRRLGVTLLAAGLALAAPAGCDDAAHEMSRAESLLARQHELWAEAREAFQAGEPRLGTLWSLRRLLCYRTPRRVEKEYGASNKAEVLAKLRELGEAYERDVYSKLDPTGGHLRLARGVTAEQLRDAFMSLDGSYRQLVEMTGG